MRKNISKLAISLSGHAFARSCQEDLKALKKLRKSPNCFKVRAFFVQIMDTMKNLLTIILFIIPILAITQKQGNIWYFGNQSGIDFSTGMPSIIINGKTGTDTNVGNQEGTSCISDSSGRLLFYTGGETIWNKDHVPMQNGTEIMGGTSSTQSSLIVPLPGSDNIFYVFTSDEFQSYINPPQKGYRYTVVDMCLDDGKGDVVSEQKNILLCDSSTEKLAACEDAEGNGYWIVGHKMYSNEFHAWHLTSGGITDTVISSIGTIHGWKNTNSTWMVGAAQGEMKINPAGNKLALAISNFDPAYLDLFDFDNNTGVINDFCHIVLDSALNKRIWGCEFSPDDSKLYAGITGGAGGRRIYQFDMTAGGGNCDSIMASRFTLFQDNGGPMNGMKTAPNGKIYLVMDYWSLNCINNPNFTGLLANFDTLAIPITGQNNYELPNFISGYKYHNGYPCDSSDAIFDLKPENIVILYPNPSNSSVTLQYELPQGEQYGEIILYDVQGAEIKRYKVDNTFNDILLDNTMLPAGTYFYQLHAGKKAVGTKKMVLLH